MVYSVVNVDSVAQCPTYAITSSLHVCKYYGVFPLEHLLLFAWIFICLSTDNRNKNYCSVLVSFIFKPVPSDCKAEASHHIRRIKIP